MPLTKSTVKSEIKRSHKLPKHKWIVEAWRRNQSGMDVRRRKLYKKCDKSIVGQGEKIHSEKKNHHNQRCGGLKEHSMSRELHVIQ